MKIVLALPGLIGLAAALCAAAPTTAGAQADATLFDPPPEQTREQWRQHVAETKRRVQEAAAIRRLSPRDVPPLEEQEQIASERVLNDDSLQPGDIVVTNKGQFIFTGKSQNGRTSGNFQPVR